MDIRMATAYARHMVLEWGMSERLGFVNYAGTDTQEMFMPEKDYSPDTAKIIDEEVRRLIDAAYEDARRIIDQNWEKVIAIAEALLRFETLSREDIDRVMRGEQLVKPTVADLLAAESAKPAAKPLPPKTEPGTDEELGGMLPSPA